MQNNRIPLLAALLVVLLVVAWLAGVFESDPSTIEVPEVRIDTEQAEAFAVVSSEIDVRLAKQGGFWTLLAPVAALADSQTVGTTLRSLSELKIASVVSSNPSRWTQYGVDSTALRLEIDGYTLHIAAQGPDFGSSYVRIGGDERVYATRARISVPQDLDRWRDKTVIALSPGSIVSAALESPGDSFEVRRGGSGWEIIRGESAGVTADSASVARWLQRFSQLKADGFYGDLTADSVRVNATRRLSFELDGGTSQTLLLAERPDGVGVLVEGRPEVMKVFASRLSTLAPDVASWER